MFANSRYLQWARRYYGHVPFDLAASGVPAVSRKELGLPRTLEDPRAWDQLQMAAAAYNDLPRDEVLPCLGTSHGIFLAYAAMIQPGDDVLVEDPSYEPLWRIAEGLGANVVRFERAASDRFRIDPKRVAAAMTPRTKVVAVTNLHNPTGVRAPDKTLRELAKLVSKSGAHLLVDEVYAPFDTLTDAGGVFRGSARKLASNVVVVSSLTKCYGLGVERIGWIAGPEAVIERAGYALTSNVGLLPLSYANLAVHAFSRVGDLADRARKLLAGKRARVEKWVKEQGLGWSAPKEGLFGLAWREDDTSDLTPAIELGIEQHGVIVAAGRFFGVQNGFRLSWASPEETLTGGLERLARTLRAKAPRKARATARR